MKHLISNVLLLTCPAALCALVYTSFTGNLSVLQEKERVELFGGDGCVPVANWCDKTFATCNPGGWNAACNFDPAFNDCDYCANTVGTWKDCISGQPDNFSCGHVFLNNNPLFCGTVFEGNPVNRNCPNGCPFNTTVPCGQQIPNQTCGVSCQ